ncbi:putative Glutamine--tRNA ligase [Blattamonas nauphoetae]|uniref:glutamine--tRNA ligase n=1 Tax=Blattamonas nauphoetae TaxID=2049346 RepID=A0ABQ9YMA1_9EUKA|nr:putative Glutamine--tRNA ligase [Blattamonas nauphoetae]
MDPFTLRLNFLPEGQEEETSRKLLEPFGPATILSFKRGFSMVQLENRAKCDAAIEALQGKDMGKGRLNISFADPNENMATLNIGGFKTEPTNDFIISLIQSSTTEKITPAGILLTKEKSGAPFALVDILGKHAKEVKAKAKEPGLFDTDGTTKLTVSDSKRKAVTVKPPPTSTPAQTPSPNQAPKESPKPQDTFDPTQFAAPGQLTDSFPPPMVNDQNTPEIMASHEKVLSEWGASVVTRFPPEPNGFLHIGHAKALFLDFGLALQAQQKATPNRPEGLTYLRFDDTNPKGETQEYIDAIIEATTGYLGYKPWKITYTSDYFDQLYDFAIRLIREGKAYVDHSTKAEIKQGRDERTESRYRNRTPEENQKLFLDMQKGVYAEGDCVLRLKMDMKHNNPNMRDAIIYRIMYLPHLRTGDKWCIYPTYDFSHCIIDSLEHVTHSMCTLEFEIRRDSYFWLLDALNLYKPIVWEMSRLNITHSVMSKRRVNALVKKGLVSGWDDPRLTTLAGLRRRGFTKEIMNSFVRRVGITRNENIIDYQLLEHCARLYLDQIARRKMAVLDPIRVEITNFEEGRTDEEKKRPFDLISAPDFPRNPTGPSRPMPFSPVVFIDRSDFQEVDSKNYYGLAPNKEVALKYGPNFVCDEFHKDAKGNVTLIRGHIDRKKSNKPKGNLTWVAQVTAEMDPENVIGVSPVPCEVHCYDHLFTTAEVDDTNWLNELNPSSHLVYPNAIVERSLVDVKREECFQFERVGFFCCDLHSTTKEQANSEANMKLIFNRTVSLREGEKKNL